MATTCERTRGMGRIPELVAHGMSSEAGRWKVSSLAIDILQCSFRKDLWFWLLGWN